VAPQGHPVAVNVHDFPDKTVGKAIAYGIYDIGANNGFVNVEITNETAAFAVASIRSWWQQLGSVGYPNATTSRSPPTAAAATATASACGRPSCSFSPTIPHLRSRSATSLPGPASGTRAA
jgi:hypothetical protein